MADRIVRFIQSPRTRRNALLLVVWVAMLTALVAVREVLLPFIIAGALAYVIDPLVSRAARLVVRGRTVPRWSAVIALYLGFGAVLWMLAVFFVPQVYRELAGIARDSTELVAKVRDPRTIEDLAERLEDLAERMRLPIRVIPGVEEHSGPAVGIVPDDVDVVTGVPVPGEPVPHRPGALIDAPLLEPDEQGTIPIYLGRIAKTALDQGLAIVKEQTTQIVSRLQVVVGGVVSLFFSFFVVLMITAFLQADTDRVKRFFFGIVPVEDRTTFDAFLSRVDRGLSGVVRGQLTICLVNGFLTLVGLLLLQVKFAFILATVAMVFSLVPIFGSILSTIPIVLVALASGPLTALLSLVWIILIHFLEANFLNPKIMGDAAKIHPVVIVLALVAGEHSYGLAGALFAVPFVSVCLTVLRSAVQKAHAFEQDIQRGPGRAAARPPTPRSKPRIWRDRPR